jgi:hypothetical protein
MSTEHLTGTNSWPLLPEVPPPGQEVSPRRNSTGETRALAGIAATAALAIGIGVTVTSQGNASAQNAGSLGRQGGPGGFAGPGAGGPPGGQNSPGQLVMGTVTEVTSTSITVDSAAANTTYAVSARTQVTVNGASALAAVTVGTHVLVQAAAAGANAAATRIVLDGFAGRGGGLPQQAGTAKLLDG